MTLSSFQQAPIKKIKRKLTRKKEILQKIEKARDASLTRYNNRNHERGNRKKTRRQQREDTTHAKLDFEMVARRLVDYDLELGLQGLTLDNRV